MTSGLVKPTGVEGRDGSEDQLSQLLEARGLYGGYGQKPILFDLHLTVGRGELVALLGPNGAGKTTTLLTLSGHLPKSRGQVLFKGAPRARPLHRRARDGLGFIPEGKTVFSSLNVRENLRVSRCDIEKAVDLFPELVPLMARSGGLLSGGEQRILALAGVLAREPDVILADELSLGLAPQVVTRLLNVLRAAADRGVGVLLVEQHVRQALNVADRGYVLRHGRIAIEGTARELSERRAEIEDSYLSEAATPTTPERA
jgi:branched-chain amino acid transport system ATP-binding protein